MFGGVCNFVLDIGGCGDLRIVSGAAEVFQVAVFIHDVSGLLFALSSLVSFSTKACIAYWGD